MKRLETDASPSAYQRAFHWVRLACLDDGRARLTPEAASDASGVEVDVVRQVLDDLVRAGFLHRAADGTYVRPRCGPD